MVGSNGQCHRGDLICIHCYSRSGWPDRHARSSRSYHDPSWCRHRLRRTKSCRTRNKREQVLFRRIRRNTTAWIHMDARSSRSLRYWSGYPRMLRRSWSGRSRIQPCTYLRNRPVLPGRRGCTNRSSKDQTMWIHRRHCSLSGLTHRRAPLPRTGRSGRTFRHYRRPHRSRSCCYRYKGSCNTRCST